MARQAAKPSEFMPWIQSVIASGMSLSPGFVKIVAEETDNQPKMIADKAQINIWLSRPTNPNINAGAGRRGTILERIIGVTLYTRAGRDRLGDDSKALGEHWDLEDQLINVLLLKVPSRVDMLDPKFFIEELRLENTPGVNRLYEVDGSKYKSSLMFRVSYLAPTTEALA